MAARKLPIILVLLLLFSVGLTAARVGLVPAGAATGDSVVLGWNQQVLDTIVATKTGPTIAVRALAVVHTAIYDAWAAYDSVAVPTMANDNGRRPSAERTLENKNKAVSFAAYTALVDLFPARQTIYAGHMVGDLGYVIDGSDTSTAATVGVVAAQACWTTATTTGPTSSATSPAARPGWPTPTTPGIGRSTPGTRSTTPTTGSRCASPPHRRVPPSAPARSRPS
jgi:hypothetical protein